MSAAKGRKLVQSLATLAVLAAVALPAGASLPQPGAHLLEPNPEALLATALDASPSGVATAVRDRDFELFADPAGDRFHLDLHAAVATPAQGRFHVLTPRKTRVRGVYFPEPISIRVELPPSDSRFRLYGEVPCNTASGAIYLAEDPLGDVDSPNLYAFVAWQPTMGTDPLGMCVGDWACPAWAREAIDRGKFNLYVQWETAKGVAGDSGRMALGAVDFVTLGHSARARASVGTFFNTEGSLIERGNVANEAGNRAQLSVVTLGFSEAEDKSQHLESLVGIQAVQDSGTVLGTAWVEGDSELLLEGLGKLAEGSGQMAGTVLAVYAPAEAGVSRLRAGRAGTSGVSNPVPERLARVVPEEFGQARTLGAPAAEDVFVTAADDIAGIGNSADLAQRLTLLDDSGNLVRGPFAVIEFETPASGIASPVYRTNPGFVGSGRTAGGAREFVLPNYRVDQLGNVVRRSVP